MGGRGWVAGRGGGVREREMECEVSDTTLLALICIIEPPTHLFKTSIDVE